MRIREFGEIYGANIREIDYWTRIGLLHPYIRRNGYRDYNEQCCREIELIMVAEVLDWPYPLEKTINILEGYDEVQWRKILEQLRVRHEQMDRRFNIAFTLASKRS